jgi:hypothetical protein
MSDFFNVDLFHITVDCIVNFRDFAPVIELCKERTSKVCHGMM